MYKCSTHEICLYDSLLSIKVLLLLLLLLITGTVGATKLGGGACEVLPLRKGGDGKVLAMLKGGGGGHAKF